MTYGAIVRQLLTDLEDVEEVNKQLDQMYGLARLAFYAFSRLALVPLCIYLLNCIKSIRLSVYSDRGYNIGIRLIDEFLAKSGVSRCVDFKETAEMIAKVSTFSIALTCLAIK